MKRCFAAAQALPDGERAAYVERASEGDAGLAAEVLALLEAATRDSALDGLLDEPSPRGGHPERIGEYRILGVAGRGGMGTVYEAEQEQPRRRVALKVVDPGRIGPGVLRRFELEAEVLGRLQHPGLARIYAAGTFDDGAGPQPYFAMEYVRGRELVEYANACELDLEARLRLLTRVAEAVSHAHSQGVVHRDLKPSNILVDESGQPKVLDFGVARVTDEDAPRVTLQTSAGQLVGTLPYMSPEQASAQPERVDERADVYALGVLLHELLTGELPLPMRGLSVQEAVRSLQEDDPAPLASHDRSLRGDVETIVSKALAKEPERRYLSADDLVEDIRRYLAHEPIVARPPTVLYQLTKFTRRHKGLVIGVGAGLLIAFGALTLALVVSLRTTGELARSEARALRQSDRSALAAAAAALELDEVARAHRQLERVSPERRGWEWDYYTAQLDTSFARFDVEAPIAALTFDAKSEILVLADATGRVRRWDPARRMVVAEVALGRALPAHSPIQFTSQVECALDGAGSRLAVLGPGAAQVFDTRTGAVLAERPLPGAVVELAIEPRGRRVALTGASGLWSWDLATDALALLDATPYLRLDFAEDGLLFALLPGPRVHAAAVYDLERGEQLRELSEWQPIFGAELASGGRELFVARADDKKAVRRLDSAGKETAYVNHSLPPRAIAWSEAGGLLASGADDHVVCIWDPDLPEAPLAELHGHAGPIERVRFGPDGRRVAATAGTLVRVWDLASPSGSLVLEHPAPVYTVDYLADGTLLSSDWKGLFRRWSPTGELLSEVQEAAAGSRLAYSKDQRWFARQRWEHLALLDAELAEVAQRDVEERDKLTDVSMSGDGSLVATRNPKAIYVARAPDLELVFHRPLDAETRPNDNRFGAVLLDRAGERLFAQDESGSLVIWELPSGRELARLSGQGGLISRLAFAPDESLLACGSTDGTTWVWDVERREVVARLERHASRVYALAFTPDMQRLATGSNDTTVRLWDLRDQVETAVFSAHTDYVYDLAFSEDGKQLASASGDGTVRIWNTVARSAR